MYLKTSIDPTVADVFYIPWCSFSWWGRWPTSHYLPVLDISVCVLPPQASSSLSPVPKTTSTSSRSSTAWWTPSARRWTRVQTATWARRPTTTRPTWRSPPAAARAAVRADGRESSLSWRDAGVCVKHPHACFHARRTAQCTFGKCYCNTVMDALLLLLGYCPTLCLPPRFVCWWNVCWDAKELHAAATRPAPPLLSSQSFVVEHDGTHTCCSWRCSCTNTRRRAVWGGNTPVYLSLAPL